MCGYVTLCAYLGMCGIEDDLDKRSCSELSQVEVLFPGHTFCMIKGVSERPAKAFLRRVSD